MNLLYVVNGRFPSERAYMVQTVKMCNAFVRAGVSTTLLVSSRKTEISEDPDMYYGEPLLFKVERSRVINLAQFGHLFPRLVAKILYTIQRVTFLWGIDASKYEIIYGRDPFILFRLGKRFGFEKVVYESHEASYNRYVQMLVEARVKIVVISEAIRDFYIEKNVPSSQILVAHDAIDESFFEAAEGVVSARKRLGLSSDKPIAMYIGGFDAWKGVETFFEASELASEVQFVAIGGNGTQIAEYQDNYPKVHFLGSRPYRELRDNQQAADILVVPNTARNALSAKYTSPLKLFAHLTSGVPIVVSDLPSMRNIVTEKEAFFFESDNGTALADCILNVIKNPAESRTRASKAYELAKEHTWLHRSAKIIDFLT